MSLFLFGFAAGGLVVLGVLGPFVLTDPRLKRVRLPLAIGARPSILRRFP